MHGITEIRLCQMSHDSQKSRAGRIRRIRNPERNASVQIAFEQAGPEPERQRLNLNSGPD